MHSELETQDQEVNRPETVAEVTAAFERYEAALIARDLDVMAASFSNGEHVLRYGISDYQRGEAELASWRAAQPALPPGRTLFDTTVTTYGSAFAVVSTLFSYPGRPALGRQSQAWVRGADGWKIVQAHVSEVSAPAT